MTTTVTGIFKSRLAAESAINQLEAAGITPGQVSLVMTDEARHSAFKFVESSKVDEGAATGAGVGGLLGTLAGGLMSASALLIPGLNIVVVGGLVSALAGLGAGALAGGLIGGLIGAGIPEHEAKLYEKEIKAGNALVAVVTDTDEQEKIVRNIFENMDAYRSAA